MIIHLLSPIPIVSGGLVEHFYKFWIWAAASMYVIHVPTTICVMCIHVCLCVCGCVWMCVRLLRFIHHPLFVCTTTAETKIA